MARPLEQERREADVLALVVLEREERSGAPVLGQRSAEARGGLGETGVELLRTARARGEQ